MNKKELECLIENKVRIVLKEYSTHVIGTWAELLAGLEEIGAPVKLVAKDKSINVDGKLFRMPVDANDTMKSIKFDDSIITALKANSKLSSMWNESLKLYEELLKQIQSFKVASNKHINYGPTGPYQIKHFYESIKNAYNQVKDIMESQKNQKILREYEVLRHLFDRGYTSLIKK